MKVLLILPLIAFAGYVYGESCRDVSTCSHTFCPNATATLHVHMECTQGQCTCSNDVNPCITKSDCTTGRCFDSDGDRGSFHCLDGGCRCVNV